MANSSSKNRRRAPTISEQDDAVRRQDILEADARVKAGLDPTPQPPAGGPGMPTTIGGKQRKTRKHHNPGKAKRDRPFFNGVIRVATDPYKASRNQLQWSDLTPEESARLTRAGIRRVCPVRFDRPELHPEPPSIEFDWNYWISLPHHIVRRRFWWAFKETQDASPDPGRRFYDYDDLVAEGAMALVDAARSYDPRKGSEFKTYAFSAIRNRVQRFIDKNRSVITMSKWPKDDDNDNPINIHIRRAARCRLFSELDKDIKEDNPVEVPDRTTDPAIEVQEAEWVKHCISKLKRGMPTKHFKLMMMKYQGKKLGEMAEVIGMCNERARLVCLEAETMSRKILLKERMALYGETEAEAEQEIARFRSSSVKNPGQRGRKPTKSNNCKRKVLEKVEPRRRSRKGDKE